MREIVSIICGYLLGSIPFAVIISKLKGIDILKVGTGNPGAGNVFREVGKKYGVVVWLCDTLKGIAALGVGSFLLTSNWVITEEMKSSELFFVSLSGVAAFCGHCWSPWLKFKGGKGVAIAGGIFVYLIPKVFLISVVAYFLVQRKPREWWVIVGAFIIVISIILGVYSSEIKWLVPFLLIFLGIALIANISTIKEIKEKLKEKKIAQSGS